MEEKERYKLIYNDEELGYSIIDTEEYLSDDIHGWNILCDLLNKQDNEINILNELLSSEQKFHDWCLKDFEEETEKLRKQIKELKGEK